jgi:hypothetical protein
MGLLPATSERNNQRTGSMEVREWDPDIPNFYPKTAIAAMNIHIDQNSTPSFRYFLGYHWASNLDEDPRPK